MLKNILTSEIIQTKTFTLMFGYRYSLLFFFYRSFYRKQTQWLCKWVVMNVNVNIHFLLSYRTLIQADTMVLLITCNTSSTFIWNQNDSISHAFESFCFSRESIILLNSCFLCLFVFFFFFVRRIRFKAWFFVVMCTCTRKKGKEMFYINIIIAVHLLRFECFEHREISSFSIMRFVFNQI